ncbi:hypothetical protein NDU88_002957 [Pleurodeles waltl]|uniref:Uncharacterized protein n=1 Tax=Pleurodeles waltl TaxID=8319 RepID=A0AAV7M358_PLEWA|nr:hypothetical protein NDU88_002957 [Pleurodeles waltl]
MGTVEAYKDGIRLLSHVKLTRPDWSPATRCNEVADREGSCALQMGALALVTNPFQLQHAPDLEQGIKDQRRALQTGASISEDMQSREPEDGSSKSISDDASITMWPSEVDVAILPDVTSKTSDDII